MKKTLVAVAALASFGAFAQSSVTLGGRVDGGVVTYSNQGGKSLTAFGGSGESGPSVWNISGKEDLGGGMNAGFTLEGGYSAGTGAIKNSNGNLFGRQAHVDLSGAFGTVSFGLQFDPAFLSAAAFDPRGYSMFGSGLNSWTTSGLTTGGQGAATTLNIFNQNAVSYSNKFGPVSASVQYVLGGVAGSSNASSVVSGSLGYSANGLTLSAGAFQDKNAAGTGGTNESNFGAAYAFGPATLSAGYLDFKRQGSNTTGHSTATTLGGGTYILGATVLSLGYYSTQDKTTTGKLNVLAVGADYALSKSTSLYAQAQSAKNSGFAGGNVLSNADGASAGLNTTVTGVAVGIRKGF
jgi:predicted porin